MREIALARDLHGEFWVDPERRQYRRVSVRAEAAHVGVRQRGAALCSWWRRVRRRGRRLAGHQTLVRHVANGLQMHACT